MNDLGMVQAGLLRVRHGNSKKRDGNSSQGKEYFRVDPAGLAAVRARMPFATLLRCFTSFRVGEERLSGTFFVGRPAGCCGWFEGSVGTGGRIVLFLRSIRSVVIVENNVKK